MATDVGTATDTVKASTKTKDNCTKKGFHR